MAKMFKISSSIEKFKIYERGGDASAVSLTGGVAQVSEAGRWSRRVGVFGLRCQLLISRFFRRRLSPVRDARHDRFRDLATRLRRQRVYARIRRAIGYGGQVRRSR